MDLTSQADVEATQEKIRVLQDRYVSLRSQPTDEAHLRELTLRSLKRVMNEMQEDVVRFQSRVSATR